MWPSWNTLGVARYRNHDWTGAREALQTGASKKECRFAFDGFFLAMTLWQTGEQDPPGSSFSNPRSGGCTMSPTMLSSCDSEPKPSN